MYARLTLLVCMGEGEEKQEGKATRGQGTAMSSESW